MADLNAVVHIKDENGNVNDIYPATKIENVEGLQSALNAKANTSDVTSGLAGKVDKESGKGLSTNDYTTTEKNKLAGIEAQANKTVVDNALSSSSTNPLQNKVIYTALGTKANTSDVTTALASKADASTVSSLSSQVSTNTINVATQTSRIDTIVALPSGSTQGDAELMDIRTKADGTTATSAGNAVREQVNSIINKSYLPRTITGTDLDAAKQAGYFHLAYATTYANSPIPANNQRFLEIENDNNFVTQKIINTDIGNVYVRRCGTDNRWTSWKQLTYTPFSVSDGTDLNDIKTAGYTHLIFAATYTNSPIPANNQRFLEVINESGTIMQRMTNSDTGDVYVRRCGVDNIWTNWYHINYSSITVSDGADLNDIKNVGYVHLAYASTYTNSPVPANNQRFLEIINDTGMVMQRMTNSDTGDVFVRRCGINGQWTNWRQNSYVSFTVSDGTDLNDVKNAGYSHLAYASTYINSPIPANNQRFLEVINDTGIIMQRMTNSDTGDVFVRRCISNDWTGWHKPVKADDTTMSEFADYNSNVSVDNVGYKMRIMSYNVANFDNDTGTKGFSNLVYEEKLFNLKRVLMKSAADIIGFQEYYEYINEGHTKPADNYLLNPLYPHITGVSSVVIAAKDSAETSNTISLGTRAARYCVISKNNKKILFLCCHATAKAVQSETATDAASIAERLEQYTKIFGWVNGTISLPIWNTETLIACPEWDYCIIMGDMNSLTSDDKTNLKTLCASSDFTLANGGYLGWINTADGGYAIDNIMCSENIIINNVEALESEYANLYSDHYPLIADITLL